MPLQPGVSPEPMRPRVLVLSSTFPRWAGDTEPRFVLDLCRALTPVADLCVLAPHAPGAARHERLEGVEVHRFRYFFDWGEGLAYDGGMLPKLRRRPWLWLVVPVYLMALVIATARVLRVRRVDLIHAHWLIPQGVAARLARGLAASAAPLVCTAHGADVFGLRGAFAQALRRWVARGSAAIAVVSSAVGRELEAGGIEPDRIRLASMGVAVPTLGDAGRDPDLVAFAGRLVEKKGVDVLIDAFARIAGERPRARLRIAGGGPELERCRQQARALGVADRVEFLGAVTHPRVLQLFAEASVAVMPSQTARDGDAEGLGLVMLEAMAAGCPVVVTDLAAVRDAIRAGESALVFPERDAGALADALRRLLGDPALAGRLAERARSDIAERFGWSAVATNYQRLYADALAPGTP